MKNKSIILAIAILQSASFFSQDHLPTQLVANNVTINPALLGSTAQGRISTNYYRMNIGGQSDQISSTNISQYIPKLNGFGGVKYTSTNQYDVFKSSKASLFYSQNIAVGNVLIRPAIEAEYGTQTIDYSNLVFGDNQYMTGGQQINTNKVFSLNTGAIVYFKNFLFGFSASHLNKSVITINNVNTVIPTNFGAQFSYAHNFNKLQLSPFSYVNFQNNFNQVTVGLKAMYNNHFNAALSMRNKDLAIFNIGYKHDVFSLNYSYSTNLSSVRLSPKMNYHEVSLLFNLWKVTPTKKLIEINSVFN